MKHCLPILFIMIIMASTLTAAEEPGIYRVPLSAQDALQDMKATVRHGRFDGDYLAVLTSQQAEQLRATGCHIVKLFDSEADELAFLRQTDGTDEFHTYTQMLDNFTALALIYPNIASFEHLGYSVQNRELFGLRITGNATLEEDEPEVVFWGCIHGNEYASAEMPYLFAYYLCENYATNPTIQQYVDQNEIWCIPLINPDGRVNGTRNNANGIDLNREFGCNWDGWGSSPYPFSQPETRAVCEFARQNNPSISISFHCSGDEFYYPWGFSPHPAPDHDLLVRLGERYTTTASYALMSSFASYQTHGEVLDWAYGCLGGLSYTAEVSSFSGSVPTTFDRNRPGMEMFCDLAAEGLHGTVTDAQTGDPLHATVWIDGNPVPAFTDPEMGDFHRIMLPGTYDLTVWANGYFPADLHDVQVALGSPGQFQVALEPDAGEYAFMVVSVNQKDPNNAYNNVTWPGWALGAPDGLPCSLGSSGFIVLDMGEGHEIVNGPGDDFTVTEVIHPRDPNPESYRVYAGDAYQQTTLLGAATGTASFDLDAAGVTSTRYLKILDTSGASPNLALAGMDLDAVTVLNSQATSTQLAMPDIPAGVARSIDLSVSPNPFNPTTTIAFDLPVASLVKLQVFDISGRQITSHQQPATSHLYNPGHHTIPFDGSNLPSGIYFYRLTAGDFTGVGKMVLMK